MRFHDPDGHVIEVGDSMAAVVKRMLLEGLDAEQTAKGSMMPPEFVEQCRRELADQGKI